MLSKYSFPFVLLTYCESVCAVSFAALNKPVLPSLQRDYPVSVSIVFFFVVFFYLLIQVNYKGSNWKLNLSSMLNRKWWEIQKMKWHFQFLKGAQLYLFVLLFCALIFRSVLIPSWTLTWFQRDPNMSPRTSQETSRLWESCFWAFSNTMPQTSGISQGHHITESSVSWFFCLLIFLLPFLVSCFSGQLLLPLQSPVSPLLSSPPSTLHPLLWFHVSGWRAGAGGTFGLTQH